MELFKMATSRHRRDSKELSSTAFLQRDTRRSAFACRGKKEHVVRSSETVFGSSLLADRYASTSVLLAKVSTVPRMHPAEVLAAF